jgi:hypothetical protein
VNRLERGSGGAFRVAGDPPWAAEPLAGGVRLRMSVTTVRFRVRPRLNGPDPSPVHTRVEGTDPGAGVDLTVLDPSSLLHGHVYALGAYGLTSHTWRFAFGAQRPLVSDRLLVGYEFHDLTDTDDTFRKYALGGPAGRTRAFSITEDYFRRRGHEAYAFVRPSPRLHLGLSFRHDRFESLPIVTNDTIIFFNRKPRPNPEVDEGTRDTWIVTGRWAVKGALYPNEVAERDAFLVRDPYGDHFIADSGLRVDATFEGSGRSDLGGTPYQRLITHVRGSHALTPLVVLTGRLLVGIGNDTPPQRLFALGGHGTLRGYAIKRFAGEDMVLATAEGRLRPGGHWPDVIGFYDGGRTWSDGEGSGWRDDVGVGLEWPTWRFSRIRIDGAYALRPPEGDDRARVHASIVLPF